MKKRLLLLLMLLIAGCQSNPTPELIATAIPYETTTPVPTWTVVNTEIPTPEPTEVAFPFISQYKYTDFVEGCGGASVLMVAKYYRVAGDENVEDVQKDMIGGDYPVDFRLLDNYLKERYNLDTQIIVTYEPIIQMLEDAGFDTSDISYVHGVPMEYPVIWIYLTVPHWVVRYHGLNYDPSIGVYEFSETENIYRPDEGLGIIVTKGE